MAGQVCGYVGHWTVKGICRKVTKNEGGGRCRVWPGAGASKRLRRRFSDDVGSGVESPLFVIRSFDGPAPMTVTDDPADALRMPE